METEEEGALFFYLNQIYEESSTMREEVPNEEEIINTVKELISNGSNVNFIYLGDSPLFIAVKLLIYPQLIELLLEQGANIEHTKIENEKEWDVFLVAFMEKFDLIQFDLYKPTLPIWLNRIDPNDSPTTKFEKINNNHKLIDKHLDAVNQILSEHHKKVVRSNSPTTISGHGGILHTKIAEYSAPTFPYYKKTGGYSKTKRFFPSSLQAKLIDKASKAKSTLVNSLPYSTISKMNPLAKKEHKDIIFFRNRLEKSLKNTNNTVEFNLDAFDISRINELYSLPHNPGKLKFITEGSFNGIFITKNKQFAYRINKDPIDSESDEAKELMAEALLTIHLANLGIAPRVIDCYFAKNDKKSGENTYLVSVSEFSKNGSLTTFLQSKSCTTDMIPRLVEKSIELYSKMIENKVFCVDVKSDNMLVSNNLELYLIDFDDQFCSKFKNMILNGKHIFSKTNRFIQKLPFSSGNSEEITNRGFFCLNILQVGVVCMRHGGGEMDENNKLLLYARALVDNIDIAKDLQSMVACAATKVSSDYTAYHILRHYLVGDPVTTEFDKVGSYKFAGYNISNDPVTIILASYFWVMYNEDLAIRYLLKTSKVKNLLKVDLGIAKILINKKD